MRLDAVLCGLLWLQATGLSAQPNSELDVRRDATVRAVEKAMPSVVNISTETVLEVRDPIAELFRDFFGPYYRRQPEAQKSLGSGVIIGEEGYLLTNFHVVQRATRITVRLWDGREYEARPLTATTGTDVALLKLVAKAGERFQAVPLGRDDDLLLGETVVALGNPFGLGGSVSRGILSAKTRRPPVENEPLDLEDWLQTDAAINPGNSGGPLINLRGELIGINVAMFRQAQGIGFAIPVKRVSEALSKIFTPEWIKSCWFGAELSGAANGVRVVSVEAGSPAERGGLRVGDRLLRVNEHLPRNAFEANRELIAAGQGASIGLLVQRGAERKNLVVRLVAEGEVFNARLIREKVGLTVQELTPELAERLNFRGVEGLWIAEVERNSPAEASGLRRGWIIEAVEGQPVVKISEVAKLLYVKKKGELIKLSLIVERSRGRFAEVYRAAATVRLR